MEQNWQRRVWCIEPRVAALSDFFLFDTMSYPHHFGLISASSGLCHRDTWKSERGSRMWESFKWMRLHQEKLERGEKRELLEVFKDFMNSPFVRFGARLDDENLLGIRQYLLTTSSKVAWSTRHYREQIYFTIIIHNLQAKNGRLTHDKSFSWTEQSENGCGEFGARLSGVLEQNSRWDLEHIDGTSRIAGESLKWITSENQQQQQQRFQGEMWTIHWLSRPLFQLLPCWMFHWMEWWPWAEHSSITERWSRVILQTMNSTKSQQ